MYSSRALVMLLVLGCGGEDGGEMDGGGMADGSGLQSPMPSWWPEQSWTCADVDNNQGVKVCQDDGNCEVLCGANYLCNAQFQITSCTQSTNESGQATCYVTAKPSGFDGASLSCCADVLVCGNWINTIPAGCDEPPHCP